MLGIISTWFNYNLIYPRFSHGREKSKDLTNLTSSEILDQLKAMDETLLANASTGSVAWSQNTLIYLEMDNIMRNWKFSDKADARTIVSTTITTAE